MDALFSEDMNSALVEEDAKLSRTAAQEMCVSFMIALFPADVLNTKAGGGEDPDNECFEASKKCARTLMCETDDTCHVIANENDPEALSIARKVLVDFVNTFASWKVYDRNRLMESLAMCHHQWSQTQQTVEAQAEYGQEVADQWKHELLVQKASIRKRMIQMGGKEWTERLLAREPTVVDVDAIIREKGQEKYWDDFAVELCATPPRFDRLITLLVEIRERLIRLVPNSVAFHNKLKAELDLDLIKQMIDNQVFDYQSFVSTFETIWGTVASLQAAEDDAAWSTWREEMQERFVAASGDNSSSWALLLPPIFNRVLMQIDRLEDKVAAARKAIEQAKADAQEERDNLLPRQEQDEKKEE